MRPIDADELYDKAEEKYKNSSTPYRLIYREFVDAVADAPTLDVQPIVYTRWEYHLMPLALKCSNCKRLITRKRKIDYKYCPYCGAMLDWDKF